MILATKYGEILAERPAGGPILPLEKRALHAALLRIVSAVEQGLSPTRWILIVLSVMIVLALLIGFNDWLSQGERSIVTTKVAPPTSPPAEPLAVIEAPPMDQPEPQFSTGLWGPINSPAKSELPELPATAPSPVPEPSPQGPRYVVVAEGQSLSRIARANHLSAKVIAAANGLEPPYLLKVGARLLIPDPDHPEPR